MGIMFATYQFFIAKRSSNIVLNKDELQLQAEISCMKQYLEFASARNELIYPDSTIYYINENFHNTEMRPNIGNPEHVKDRIKYNCRDNENILVSKYCLKGGVVTSCDEINDTTCKSANDDKGGLHCVSATKWIKFSPKNKYLTSQIMKNGAYWVDPKKENENEEKYQKYNLNTPTGQQSLAIFEKSPANTGDGSTIKGVGIMNCINACKVSLQRKLHNETGCESGQILTANPNGNGFTCVDVFASSPCTAHEQEYTKDFVQTYLPNIEQTNLDYSYIWETKDEEGKVCKGPQNNGNYCCPIKFHNYDDPDSYCKDNPNAFNCCPSGTTYKWDNNARFYRCEDISAKCVSTVQMVFVDEKNTPILSPITIGNMNDENNPDPATTSQYKVVNGVGNVYCSVIPSKFIDKCKEYQNSEQAYLSTTNLKTDIEASEFAEKINSNADGNYKPVCRLALKANANATENCSPCQGVIFNKDLNKWQCRDYTWNDFKLNTDNIMNQNSSFIEKCLKKTCSHNGSGFDYSTIDATNTNTNPGTEQTEVQEVSYIYEQNQILQIQRGIRNGKYWGLTWNNESKMWSCFNCDRSNSYNYIFNCVGGAPKTNSVEKYNPSTHDHWHIDTEDNRTSCIPNNGWQESTEGKCYPFDCAPDFQIKIGNKCYTKWCQPDSEYFPINAEINKPMLINCPESSPWMALDYIHKCVYCIRPPSQPYSPTPPEDEEGQ